MNLSVPAYGPQLTKTLWVVILLEFSMIGATVVRIGQLLLPLLVPPLEDEEEDEEEDDDELEDELTAPAHVGTVIVSAVVVTVPPNANALPVQFTVLPMVIPDASISAPANVVFAPSVVAAIGVQKTSQAEAPFAKLTTELATVVSAPFILKIYVPLPERVIPAAPMLAAPGPDVQYTPGV